LYFARHIAIGVCERKLFMEIEEEAFDYGEPSQEEITHKHPMLPFIAITQTRYLDAELGDERFEDWQFLIWGPDLIVAYDNVAYKRLNKTEQEMIDDLAKRAEEHLLNDGGPFLVLRAYFETGEYRGVRPIENDDGDGTFSVTSLRSVELAGPRKMSRSLRWSARVRW
jgi:hypothetical protein